MGESWLARLRVNFRSFLCAGCGLGEGHVAPVYTKWLARSVVAVKHSDFCTFYIKILSGAIGGSGCLLGASWVPLGCLLGASWVPSGCFLGASWVSGACLQIIPDASRWHQMPSDVSRCIYVYIHMNIHCLLRGGHGICQEKLCPETLFSITCLSCHSLF